MGRSGGGRGEIGTGRKKEFTSFIGIIHLPRNESILLYFIFYFFTILNKKKD